MPDALDITGVERVADPPLLLQCAAITTLSSKLCYSDAMKRQTVIETLKAHEAELKRLGVEHLYLFGSTARDEATADSDVDLFFDHPEGSLGLYELMDVKEAASRMLGCKTDIMTRRSIHRTLRDEIQASAQLVF